MANPGPSIQSTPLSQAILNANGFQLLFVLRNANLATVTDQKFLRVFDGITWDPQFITANQVSGAYNTACLGGIFSLSGKGGSAIVAVGQSYSALTGSFTHTNCTIQANTTTFTTDPYFSLSTANAIPLIADIFIYGMCYD